MAALLDLLLANANVITMNAACPRARTIGIKDGMISRVSAEESVPREEIGPGTRVIDCGGRTVVPGFIEPHGHLVSHAKSFAALDVGPDQVSSIADLLQLIRQAARRTPPGTWIIGRGYDEFGLAEKRHATRWELDSAAPGHPVKLTHRSGHAHLLNSRALEHARIALETGDPPGGLIDRSATGEPTGLLYGMGKYLARQTAAAEAELAERGMRAAGRSLAQLGITSLHDVSVKNDWSRRHLFRAWQRRGDVPQRIHMAVGWEAFQTLHDGRFFEDGETEDDFLAMGGVKIIVHEVTGRMSPDQSQLNEMVLAVHRAGQRAVIHAVEERHISAACSAIEHAVRVTKQANHRHRIEHCSVCPPALARRLAAAGITVVTHPAFVYYNGDRYVETVPPDEFVHLYPVGTLLRNGVSVAGSADVPIVPANPLVGMHGAVTRRTRRGQFVLPGERITPLEALRLYTVQAAWAIGAETTRGSIEPGKYADLVALSDDPLRVPASSMKEIQVDLTIIGGRVVWERS